MKLTGKMLKEKWNGLGDESCRGQEAQRRARCLQDFKPADVDMVGFAWLATGKIEKTSGRRFPVI